MKKIIFVLSLLIAAMLIFGCTQDVEKATSGTGGAVVSENGGNNVDNTDSDTTTTTTTITDTTTTTTVETSQAINPQTQATRAVQYGEGVGESGIYYQLGLSANFVYSAQECEDSEDSFKKTIFYVDYQKPNPLIESISLKFYNDETLRKKSLGQYASTTGITRIFGEISGECYSKGWVEMYNDGNSELLWSGPVYPIS